MTTPSGSKTVGFVGIGQMGAPIAEQLAAGGVDLVVHDLRPGVAEEFATRVGVRAASSAPQLAAECATLITMLPDGNAVRHALEEAGKGELGGLAAFGPDGLVIDMSSSDPSGTVTLGSALADVGVALVDAPVSGGVSRAQKGTLTILLGGSDDSVGRAQTLLAPAGEALIHVGPAGAAHALKALNNVMSAAGLLLAAETILVGARFGLKPSTMVDVLNVSTGRNHATETKVAQYILSGSYDSGFKADLMLKDLAIALGIGRDTSTPMPLASLVASMWSLATAGLPSGADQMHVVEWLERAVGTRLSEVEANSAG